MLNDGWNEQIVKRGLTAWKIPSVLQPGLTWMWGLVIVAGGGIFFTAFQTSCDHGAPHRLTTKTERRGRADGRRTSMSREGVNCEENRKAASAPGPGWDGRARGRRVRCGNLGLASTRA